MGDVSRHGIEAPPTNTSVPRRKKCYPSRWTEVSPMSPDCAKRNKSGEQRTFRPIRFLPGGTFEATNVPLRQLIGLAYGIEPDLLKARIVGGANSILSARFDIRAKPPFAVSKDDTLGMLKMLLAERFKLRARTEMRPVPVYALTVTRTDRFGPQLRRSKYNCREMLGQKRAAGTDVDEPKNARNEPLCGRIVRFDPDGIVWTNAGTIEDLISNIRTFSGLDRPVTDKTELTGNFEWVLTFAPFYVRDSPQPTLFSALQEQLGLKLQPDRVFMDVVVIDSVSMPDPD